MANFNNCIDFVLSHEGGYFEDKISGEKSNFGVTQKLLMTINYFTKDPKELTINDAKNIYMQQFWVKYRLDLFTSDKVARKIFDMMVNMGPHQAILLVQDSLGYIGYMRDGILGHFTRCEINERTEVLLLERVVAQCQSFYKKIASDDPNKAKYLAGWLVRAGEV